MKNTIVLFTSSYPYQGGEQFLEAEIKYLSDAFEKVIIVPAKKHHLVRDVPGNVEVDDSIARSNKSILNRLYALLSKNFVFNLSMNRKENTYLVRNVIYIKLYTIWIENFVKQNNIDKTIFYTYWFSFSTVSLAVMKNELNNNIKYITRAHGGDLYAERHGFKKFPGRKRAIENINKIFSISENGKEYLNKRYNRTDKITVSRLGVLSQKELSKPSSDSKLRIVSCSGLISVKRIHLIIDALSTIKDIQVLWIHIGDGILRENLENMARVKLGSNIQYNFTGSLSNLDVLKLYIENPVDLFINLSESEGIPVSIMEAQSVGVPVIATNVGGTGEIVNMDNGYLLNENPTNEQIVNVLYDCFKSKNSWAEKRVRSFQNWKENYNGDINYTSFCNDLTGLLLNNPKSHSS